MEPDDPRNPAQLHEGLAAAETQPEGNVGQVCEECPDNWVEAGAVDEITGAPIPGIGYRIYDMASGDQVASGVLDDEGQSPRHQIPMPATQLYVVYGTEEAMDEAEAQLEQQRRQRALKQNAVSEWRGFDAGLTREAFDAQHWERTRNGDLVTADRGFLGQAARGAGGLGRLPGAIGEAVFGDGLQAAAMDYYEPYRDEAWEQYQLATGARAASSGESFGAAVPQGTTFGFDEEISAGLNSLFDNRSYEEIVTAQRQILRQNQISNPGAFLGGEIVGAIPTVFIPVGGAAANAARAGQGLRGTMLAGGGAGALTGGVSGFGHDEGGFVDRLDGAGMGAFTGGLGGAVLSGAGVLVARGVSRTRIWGRITARAERFIPDSPVHVSDAHSINTIRPNTRFGGGNRNSPKTVARGDVDLSSDIAEINAGQAFRLDNGDILTNSGRVYGTHGAESAAVFPRSGPGLVNLTQAEFSVLRTMTSSGGMTGNAERALAGMIRSGNPGVTSASRQRLIDLFASRTAP
ncbi:hypothetical protein So717_26500 [Roseobacter cerasinus]|uniref:Uncharacterized protein n=1 Tax=Roseobacter cerasinus TaxID=2602289 RepID=A0A640VSW4_9RHOB|nr:hypothetical protein [Roseobacter cerasinus]GFE50897.1 hypothetical protein So717_26500 [Roseobacter cerasinus]